MSEADQRSDSTSAEVPQAEERGPIAWMTRNSVAANMLMVVLIVGGLIGLIMTKQEVFPEVQIDTVQVDVPYPGASPSEVEQGIVLAIEEEVSGIDGVKRVTSTSREGSAQIKVELLLGENPDQVLNDVKSAVDRITTFPEDAEEATIALMSNAQPVVSLMIYGDQRLQVLHDLAEEARLGLRSAGVTKVEMEGVPPLEVSIEVSRQDLENYGLTLDDVSRAVSAASLELPGGELETAGGELLVRMDERRRLGFEFEEIILRGTADGSQIRLGDVAEIRDHFEDTDQASYYDGLPAVRVTAFRVGDETPKGVAAIVKDYRAEFESKLPANVKVAVWNDDSEVLEARIDLLLRNAGMGLVLVVLVLALFLDLRLALWVSLGIPISFLGSFLVLGSTDLSVNMISLFAFIITLGMVVDDAIVVGEHTFSKIESGMKPMPAAIEAAKQMALPVTFAILTTIAAFSPMFFVPGTMGKFFKMIPTVVVAVLILSLIESFFVLPAHLAHSKAKAESDHEDGGDRGFRPLRWVRIRVDAGLMWFIERVYQPLAHFLIRGRYVVAAVAAAMFFVTVGVVGSGLIAFNFFPVLEGDVVTATARFPYGTDVAVTSDAQRKLEGAANRMIDENGGREALLRGVYTRLGSEAPPDGPSPTPPETGSHVVSVQLMLTPSDTREVGAETLANAWREQMPEVSGLESLTFNATGGPSAGAAVDVQLIHPDREVLAAASATVTDELHNYATLKNVRNDYAAGKPQLNFHLRPEARYLGLTTTDVARQVRAAFFGAEAIREQRGRNELKIMVRLPEAQRRSEYDLEQLQIRTPTGGFVPLGYVADFERDRAATAIYREDGSRKINVKANLAEGVESSRETLASLQDEVFPALKEQYPSLDISLAGEQREQGEALTALGAGYAFAMVAIYALLAIPFRSYIQPLIVMSVIPLGLTGAVLGHLGMGYPLSIMSIFGIVALSGVVVNDSLVLVDATNGFRRAGLMPIEAVVQGSASRLRPILLTSLTTFFGLAPMLAERSLQARFLIPMAISLGFGVLFATFVVLLLVPCLYAIVADAQWLFSRTSREQYEEKRRLREQHGEAAKPDVDWQNQPLPGAAVDVPQPAAPSAARQADGEVHAASAPDPAE